MDPLKSETEWPSETEWLTVPDFAEQIGETPSRVRRQIEEKAVIAIKIAGINKIPSSFIKSGEILKELKGTIVLLSDAGYSDEEALRWLLSENEFLNSSPIAALRVGRKSEVRRVVQSLAF